MNKSESIKELANALCKFQSELSIAKKRETNPFFKSKYADLTEIWDVCRPVLATHGLSLAQMASMSGDNIVLTTMLMHTSGEWLSGDLLLTPAKSNDPQSMGSAITYGRRYAMSAMLGVATEDDDGEAAMGRQFITKPEPKPKDTVKATEPTPSPAQQAGEASEKPVCTFAFGSLTEFTKSVQQLGKELKVRDPGFDAAKFLKDNFGVEKLREIPVEKRNSVIDMLIARRN